MARKREKKKKENGRKRKFIPTVVRPQISNEKEKLPEMRFSVFLPVVWGAGVARDVQPVSTENAGNGARLYPLDVPWM